MHTHARTQSAGHRAQGTEQRVQSRELTVVLHGSTLHMSIHMPINMSVHMSFLMSVAMAIHIHMSVRMSIRMAVHRAWSSGGGWCGLLCCMGQR